MSVEVHGPSGDSLVLQAGDRVIVGRGPDAGVCTGRERWLSRTTAEISVRADGVLISNLSRKEALHIRTRTYDITTHDITLPAMAADTDPVSAFLSSGQALIGSAVMFDSKRHVYLELAERHAASVPVDAPAPGPGPAAAPGPGSGTGDEGGMAEVPLLGRDSRRLTTSRLVGLNPCTKEFMVALLLCRPWLEDPSRVAPLPGRPEIAISALQITSAWHILDRLDARPAMQQLLKDQVRAHLRSIGAKLIGAYTGVARHGDHVSDSAIATALLHYDVITQDHLALLNGSDEMWLSAQELKWWNSIDFDSGQAPSMDL